MAAFFSRPRNNTYAVYPISSSKTGFVPITLAGAGHLSKFVLDSLSWWALSQPNCHIEVYRKGETPGEPVFTFKPVDFTNWIKTNVSVFTKGSIDTSALSQFGFFNYI
jgi:hypothetical protein